MKISAIIINKNEGNFLRDCLESVKWTDEVVFLDGGSTDESLEIAREYKAKVYMQKTKNFAGWRTEAIDLAKGDWVFYIDADERVTPLLKKEIEAEINKESQLFSCFALPRRNFLLGKELRHGGWYPDHVKRLFLRKNLERWLGELHEEPVFKGEMGKLVNPMVHLQPETLEPALAKSIRWSGIEANLIYQSGHPLITWWRVLRMGLTTLFERLIKKQGYRDGVEGFIESIYQAFHTMLVYLKLWERQDIPPLAGQADKHRRETDGLG